MNQSIKGLYVLVIATMFSPLVNASQAETILHELMIPPQTQRIQISSHTVHNDTPMAVAAIRSTHSVEFVLDFYRQLWGISSADNFRESHHVPKIPGVIEYKAAQWSIISTLKNQHSVVVQLASESANTTSGYLSVVPLTDPGLTKQASSISENIANKIGESLTFTTLLSRTRSVDAGAQSDFSVFSSLLNVSRTAQALREQLRINGWLNVWQSQRRGQQVFYQERAGSMVQVVVIDTPYNALYSTPVDALQQNSDVTNPLLRDSLALIVINEVFVK